MDFLSLMNILPTPNFSLNYLIHKKIIQEFDKAIKDFVQENKVVGLAVGINVKGFTVYKKGFGFQNREKQIKICPETTLFRWASMSKMITSILALKLSSEGKINMEEDINNYLEDYPSRSNLITKECPKGYPFIRYNNKYIMCENGFAYIESKIFPAITPLLLLSNRSGICSYDNTPFKSYPSEKDLEDPHLYLQDFSFFLNYFKNIPLVSLPGEEFNYTTFGFNLLGNILEKASGLSYLELVNRYIKNGDKSKYPTLMPDKGKDKHLYSNRAVGYSKGKPTNDTDVSFKLPGGGFMSNLDDALDFCVDLKKHLTTYDKVLAWSRYDPLSNYGLGFVVWDGRDNEYFSVGHTGSQQKASTILQYYPFQDICVVALSNDEDFSTKKFKEIIHPLLKQNKLLI